MLLRGLSVLLLFSLPAVVLSQTPAIAPRPVSSDDTRTNEPLTEEQRQAEEELKRLINSRDMLTKELQRLRQITGQHQQVITHVKVCELSLDKVRDADIHVDSVDSKWLRDGFAAALSVGVFDRPG